MKYTTSDGRSAAVVATRVRMAQPSLKYGTKTQPWLGVPESHRLMLGVTSRVCRATLPCMSLTDGPQSVSIVACGKGQVVEGIGMLL